ncbi:MAG: peptidoglycan-N-acetylglucosamine deacetylase [Chthoniobacter sp.]|jgi:peptidoglycan/xylan/chitin deacetylase (PgdA/CDA1 family)|nr:peptidoglycan-N-acetylglucosamine deacetylase [Chthoniobacter sp.]
MVRSLLACSLITFSAACAAPNSAPPATNSTPEPPVTAAEPSVPVPAAPAKVTYSQCNVDGPYLAMTFDDGPHAENTPRLLDMLKQRGLKATFFVVGQCAAENPNIMKRIVEEGHEIANHSWSHPSLNKMGEGAVTDQLQRTHDVIVQTTGVTPKLMRPPYGAFTANQAKWANHKWGYKVILWDVDPLDWKIRNAEHVKGAILKGAVSGSIILSHDIHKTTIDAMPGTLDGLSAKGFKFVTVSELIAMDRPVVPKPKTTPAPKVDDATPKSTGAAHSAPSLAAGPAKK